MRPPADRTLELNGGTDVPAFTARRDHIGRRPIVIVATGLGILSTTLAWQFMTLSGRTDASLVRVAALNFAWWYLWALFAPGVIWLSRRARIERGSLRRAAAVHLPAVVIFSCAHIAMMQAAQWWLARSERAASGWWHEVQRSAVLYLDWEMMTYWALSLIHI